MLQVTHYYFPPLQASLLGYRYKATNFTRAKMLDISLSVKRLHDGLF